MSTAHRASVLAITSGKGGVGKTNVAVNLAVALQTRGYRTGILDADFGLGNVDVLLGLAPQSHLGHVLTGERTLDEVTLEGPRGIRIVPASSGLRALTALSGPQRMRLAQAVDAVRGRLDFLIIDTASGIADNVVETIVLADRAIVVTSLDPAAIVDAYATVKVMTAEAPALEIGIVVNGASSAEDAAVTFRQLDVAATRYLGRSLQYYGFIVDDPGVREAVATQRAVVESDPGAPASRCFRILAARIGGLSPIRGRGLRLVPAAGDRAPEGHEVSQCA